MSDQARQRMLRDALKVALERATVERYERRQRQARSGRAAARDAARPLKFDEGGFPVRQRNSTFLARVGRLLSAG